MHSLQAPVCQKQGLLAILPKKKVQHATVKLNRDEIFHATFQLLLANLLNHQHLITKLSTEQLLAVVAEIKWLGLGDLPKLHIFMVFMQLFTSIAFASLASFRWGTLLLSHFICSVAQMCIRVCEVCPKSHAKDWQDFVQVLGGMLIFFLQPTAQKKAEPFIMPCSKWLKVTQYI